ncbi:MAG: B12-binding domain-containing radical SAM protein, partial [Pseudobdellovibrio sp.]
DIMNHMRGLPNDLKGDRIEGSNSLYIDSLKHYRLPHWGDLQIRYKENDFIQPEESLTIEMSRGCVFQCKFCAYPITGKKGTDHIRSVESIRDELQLNYDKYGTVSYYFSEETVNDSIIKLKALQEAVAPLKFRPEFTGFFRADLIHTYPETIQMFKDANVVGMHFGIETFHPKAEVAIGKGLASEKIKEVIYRMRDSMGPEFRMVGSFIVGLPFEPIESIYETQSWLEKPDSPLGAWLWYPLMIPDPKAKLQSSYFSHHFETYGYETIGLLPEDKRMLHWRLPHIDYYGAVKLRNELDERSKPFRKLSPWTAVACKGLGLAPDNYFYQGIVDPSRVDWTHLHEIASNKIHRYIEKKLKS